MAKPGKLAELEQTHGRLDVVIPNAVNQHGAIKPAARELGVAESTISMWLKDNGFKQVKRWEKGSMA